MKKRNINGITAGALFAASYVVLTFVSQIFGLASGAIQFRLSECLTVFAYMGSYSIMGLTVGCFLANLLTGCALWDIIFGSVATLIGAVGTYYIHKVSDKLLWLPPVLSNCIIVPVVLQKVYGVTDAYWYLMLTVGIGEIAMCLAVGMLVHKAVKKRIEKLGEI